MNWMKRLLSAVTAISICFSCIPLQASAVTLEAEMPALVNSSELSGTCGKDVRWWYDSSGTLTIAGNDTMTSAPWKTMGLQSEVTRLVVDKSVTNILDDAFSGFTALQSASLPDSLVTIGAGAFSGCKNLTEINLPDSVKFIGKSSFDGTSCTVSQGGLRYLGDWCVGYEDGIEAAMIQSGTRWMADSIFANCTTLKTVIFPTSLEYIPEKAFSGCIHLAKVDIPGNIKRISNHAFEFCIGVSSLTFGDGVEEIGEEAFSNCTSLTSVTIPASVIQIRLNAFYDCKNFKSAIILNPDCYIGYGAFPCCDISGYENSSAYEYCSHSAGNFVSLGGSGNFGESFAWSYDAATQKLTITGSGAFPDWKDTTETPWYCFCSRISTVELPVGLTSIGSFAFCSCTELKSVTLPKRVKSIGNNAFAGCNSLERIELPDYCSAIGENAFSGCKSLYEIQLPTALKSIGSQAFAGCETLIALTIPESVTSIGEDVLGECTALQTLRIECGICPESLIQYTPTGCVIYGVAGTAAEKYANTYNRKFVPIEASGSCGQFMKYTWDHENKTLILEHSGANQNFANYGVMSDFSAEKPAPWYAYSAEIEKISFPDGMEIIGAYAFAGCKKLEELTIPETVKNINDHAFYNCEALESITIQNDKCSLFSNQYTISNDDDGFSGVICCSKNSYAASYAAKYGYNCKFYEDMSGSCGKNLKWTLDDDGVLTISGSGAIADNISSDSGYDIWDPEKVKTLIIGDGVTSIGESAFSEYEKLESVSLPDSLLSISANAFNGCIALNKAELPAHLESIQEKAFYHCQALETVILPESMNYVGDSAFGYCISLESVTILNPVCEIYNSEMTFSNKQDDRSVQFDTGAFYTYYYENTVVIYGYSGSTAQTYAEIYDLTFHSLYDPTAVTTTAVTSTSATTTTTKTTTTTTSTTAVTIVDSGTCGENLTWELNSKGQLTISGTGAMDDYRYPTSPPWRDYASTRIKSLVLPDGLTFIGSEAFNGCKLLTAVRIPDSVTSTGRAAFGGTGLTSVTIPGSMKVIAESAFSGCEKLTSVIISPGVEEIGICAFNACYKLQSIEIPEGVTTIGASAFYECLALWSVTIPDSLTEISYKSFYHCHEHLTFYLYDNSYAKKYAFENDIDCQIIEKPVETTSRPEVITASTTTTTTVNTVTTSTMPETTTFTSPYTTPETTTVTTTYTTQDTTTVTTTYTTQDTTTVTSTYTMPETTTVTTTSTTETNVSTFTLPVSEIHLSVDSQYTIENVDGMTFSSDHPEFAVVSARGVITAMSVGTAIITITNMRGEIALLTVVVTEDNKVIYDLGDVDGNDTINALDASQILIAAAMLGAGNSSGLTSEQQKAADVNSDGEVNAADATIVLMYAAAVGAGESDTALTDFA